LCMVGMVWYGMVWGRTQKSLTIRSLIETLGTATGTQLQGARGHGGTGDLF